MSSTCWLKSNSISKLREPCGTAEVVSPLEVTYRATCQLWLSQGVCCKRILPTTWVHRCKVARVSCNASNFSSGHCALMGSAMSIKMPHCSHSVKGCRHAPSAVSCNGLSCVERGGCRGGGRRGTERGV